MVSESWEGPLARSAALFALAQPQVGLFQPLTLTFPGAWAGVWQFLGQKLLAVLMGGCIFSHVCQVAPRERNTLPYYHIFELQSSVFARVPGGSA